MHEPECQLVNHVALVHSFTGRTVMLGLSDHSPGLRAGYAGARALGAVLIHSSAGTITSLTQSHMSFPSSPMSLVGTEPMATTSWCSGTTAMS